MTGTSFMGMTLLDATAQERLLSFPALIAALEKAHQGEPPDSGRLHLEEAGSGDTTRHFILLPAWQKGDAIGVKLVTSFPDNPARGRVEPSVHALYAVFDSDTGRPQALIDGTALTYWKTAADSGLGARYLAPPEPKTLLMVGAGALAPHLVAAHRAARPSLQNVLVWNRTADRAAALAKQLQAPDLAAEAVSDLEAAVKHADLISCATGSRTPLIQGAWLQAGQHLDLVGGFQPDMQEADSRALQRARVFVDSRQYTLGVCGDLVIPMAAGLLTEEDILGDLFELCRATVPGRQTAEEITLFKNAGGGHLDLMTARFLVELATAEASKSP